MADPPPQPDPADASPRPGDTTPIEPVGPATPTMPERRGPRRLWAEATATSGARVATVLALALSSLLVIALVTAAAIGIARGVDDHDARVGGRDAPAQRGGDGARGPGPAQPGQRGQANGNRYGNQGKGNGMGPGGLGREGLGLPGPGTGAAAALHGELVARQGVTYLFQRGQVTASSATGITVRSTDGFTASYAVNDQTVIRGGTVPAVGTAVLVVATKAGARAVQIRATGS